MKKTLRVSAALAVFVLPFALRFAAAEVRTKTVEYKQGGAVLRGYLAWDDAVKGKRPGVLVVHEWWGLNDYAKLRARELAAMGYVAFAADIYGGGRTATTRADASKLAGSFRGKDRSLLRARARAGLEQLKAHPLVDPDKVAAIGFCFGGTTVLELARSGAELRAVVSFHGGLSTPDRSDAKQIKAAVLVLSGGKDRSASDSELAAFMNEMRATTVDWQVNIYHNAVHAFTNPAAGNDPARGVAYDKVAARRSLAAMKRFFTETIGLPNPAAKVEW